MGYRVMTYWTNQGEDLAYVIVKPTSLLHLNINTHPLLHYPPRLSYVAAPQGFSLDDLKKELQLMLLACDEPLLHMEPERIIPAKVVEK